MRLTRFTPLLVVALLFLNGCDPPGKQDWEKAIALASLNGYQEFLAKHPTSRYAAEAAKRIEAIEQDAFRKAEAQGDIEAYKRFLVEFPHSPLAREVAFRIEKTAFDTAKQSGRVVSYEFFLRDFPSGALAEEARKALAAIPSVRVVITEIYGPGNASEFAKSEWWQWKVSSFLEGFGLRPVTSEAEATLTIDIRGTALRGNYAPVPGAWGGDPRWTGARVNATVTFAANGARKYRATVSHLEPPPSHVEASAGQSPRDAPFKSAQSKLFEAVFAALAREYGLEYLARGADANVYPSYFREAEAGGSKSAKW